MVVIGSLVTEICSCFQIFETLGAFCFDSVLIFHGKWKWKADLIIMVSIDSCGGDWRKWVSVSWVLFLLLAMANTQAMESACVYIMSKGLSPLRGLRPIMLIFCCKIYAAMVAKKKAPLPFTPTKESPKPQLVVDLAFQS